MENESQAFKKSKEEASKREQAVKAAMGRVVKRLGCRLPDCSLWCIPFGPLAYFVFDDGEDAKKAEQIRGDVEKLLMEELARGGVTTDAKRMGVHLISGKELALPKG